MTPHRVRLDSIDLLRGLVMVLMALDHTRDFFSASGFNPRDVNEPALFLTRWVTHFCAPVFVFLAGTSAFLYGARGGTTREVSRFLFTRGLWLVLLELTIIRYAWTFSVFPGFVPLQVIWAIGISMLVLSGLIQLPRWAIGAIGIGMILGHNLLDGIRAEQLGQFDWLWNVLHQPARLRPAYDIAVLALYPLIPWIGVMAAGFALGPVMLLEPALRRRWLIWVGVVVTVGFVLPRRDPRPEHAPIRRATARPGSAPAASAAKWFRSWRNPNMWCDHPYTVLARPRVTTRMEMPLPTYRTPLGAAVRPSKRLLGNGPRGSAQGK